MAVTKLTHGRGISYQMSIKIDGRQIRRRFPTSRQAHDEYARLRQSVNDGSYIAADRSRITFNSYADEWIANRVVRPSTLASYRGNLDKHLRPVFGNTRLDKITRSQVQAFVRQLCDTKLAPATVRGIANLLRIILRSAVDDGRLLKTPAQRIKLPELPPKQLPVFNRDQVIALIAAALPRERAMLLLALGTGLRQAELLGVTVPALDLEGGLLRVEKQLLTADKAGRPLLTPLLKTKASRRTVPLPRFVIDALRTHLSAYADDIQNNPHQLLFLTTHGNPWRRGTINTYLWKPLLKRAGLPSGYGMHALRHTYASTLIAEGESGKVVQERLGHASISETMDTYTHLFPDSHASTATALDRHYAGLQAPRHLRAM